MVRTLIEAFRKLGFVVLLKAVTINTLGCIALHSANFDDIGPAQTVKTTFKDIIKWSMFQYSTIHLLQIILIFLVFPHLIRLWPNFISKQLYLGALFFIIVGISGLIKNYGPGKHTGSNFDIPGNGLTNTPTCTICCLVIALLLIQEIYAGYREDVCSSNNIVKEIETDA